MKNKIDYSKLGKQNRLKGLEFEKRVRKDLNERNIFVSKWQNNVDLNNNKLVVARPGKYKLMQTGFPDFIAYDLFASSVDEETLLYDVIFVEVRSNGRLTPEEKNKAKWYLKNNYCSQFFIASKVKIKNKIEIKYDIINKKEEMI